MNQCQLHVYYYYYLDALFNDSVEHYIKAGDVEIKHLVEDCEKDYETSLLGKMPEVKVVVPPSLTKERLIEIQKKLTLSMNIFICRKILASS